MNNLSRKLYIFGAGQLGKVILYHFSNSSDREVEAFVVDDEFYSEDVFCGVPVLKESEFKQLDKNTVEVFVAIGPNKMNKSRYDVYTRLKLEGYRFSNFIGKNVILEGEVGENCFIGHGSIINPYVKIGNNNIIWEGCIISNDVIIGDHNYLSPRVNIGTFSEVKSRVIIGTASNIKTRVIIEDKTLIGASCYISKNTKECGIYAERSSKYLGDKSELIDISMPTGD